MGSFYSCLCFNISNAFTLLFLKALKSLHFPNLRTSEIHLFYSLLFSYWHFLEILWLFIFLVFYLSWFLSYFLFLLISDIFCIQMVLEVNNLVFWNSIHLEVASNSFCLLINSSWLLVFILYVFFMIFSGFNLYCWKGIHFS